MISQNEKKILLVGEHLDLSRKRMASLARTGAQVVISDPAELQTHLGLEVFDLVVMCHIMRDEVRCSVTQHARQRWPGVKILQIFESTLDVVPTVCSADERVPDTPDELMKSAEGLLLRSA